MDYTFADLKKGWLLFFVCLLYGVPGVKAMGNGGTLYAAGGGGTVGRSAGSGAARAIRSERPMGNRQAAAKKPKVWEVLFDGKHTDKWRSLNGNGDPSQGWQIKDGLLSVKEHAKGEDIITKEAYGDFELVFDFNLTFSANSGIKYLVSEIKNNSTGKMEWNGPEYQIIDDYNHPEVKNHQHDEGATASLYLAYAPQNKKLQPAGKWNTGRILVRGNHIEHWLNGVRVVNCERGTADFRKRMNATKFKVYDRYGEVLQGHIMLTDHDGDPCYFRNIRIRRLDQATVSTVMLNQADHTKLFNHY